MDWNLVNMLHSMSVTAKGVVVMLLLGEGKLEEAIAIAARNRKSPIASLVGTGLKEFTCAPSHSTSAELVDAARRGLDRSVATIHAELKRGLSGLATIGSTAPFVGLFGTVVGIMNAFRASAPARAAGIQSVASRISEALVPRPSYYSSPCPPCGATTTSRAQSRTSMWRWRTLRWNL